MAWNLRSAQAEIACWLSERITLSINPRLLATSRESFVLTEILRLIHAPCLKIDFSIFIRMGARFSGATEEAQYSEDADDTTSNPEEAPGSADEPIEHAKEMTPSSDFRDPAEWRQRRSATIVESLCNSRDINIRWFTDLVVQFLLSPIPGSNAFSIASPH